MAHEDNKADLADFLSNQLIMSSQTTLSNVTVVVGGGFHGEFNSQSSSGNVDHLCTDQEEADTRMIVHAKDAQNTGCLRLKVVCRDTDVLLLLVYHIGDEIECWMVSGSGRNRRCYPIHITSKTLDHDVKSSILGFHALTGCDTTSSFFGIGKKSCWKQYCANPTLLQGIGSDGELASIEQFLCGLYGCSPESHNTGVNTCRYRLFLKARKSLEQLPPTADALQLHVKRANYQAKFWVKAANSEFKATDPIVTGGWSIKDGVTSPVWMHNPSVPQACMQIVSCGYKKSAAQRDASAINQISLAFSSVGAMQSIV